MQVSIPVAQVEHGASQGMLELIKYTLWMQCKSLCIKASIDEKISATFLL